MEGILTFGTFFRANRHLTSPPVLLFVCTCAYLKRVPKIKDILFAEKNGVFGSLYKGNSVHPVAFADTYMTGAVIGTRLHMAVSLSCLAMGVYLLILK